MSAPPRTDYELFDARDLERMSSPQDDEREERRHLRQVDVLASNWKQLHDRNVIEIELASMRPQDRERFLARVILDDFKAVCSDEPPAALTILLAHVHTPAGLLHVIRYVALAFMLAYQETPPDELVATPSEWFQLLVLRYMEATSADETMRISELLHDVFRVQAGFVGSYLDLREPFSHWFLMKGHYWFARIMHACTRVWYAGTPGLIRHASEEEKEDAAFIDHEWQTYVVEPVLEAHWQKVWSLIEGGVPEWRIKPRTTSGRKHTARTRKQPESYEQVRPTMAAVTTTLVAGYLYDPRIGTHIRDGIESSDDESMPDPVVEEEEQQQQPNYDQTATYRAELADIDAGIERARERHRRIATSLDDMRDITDPDERFETALAAMREAQQAINQTTTAHRQAQLTAIGWMSPVSRKRNQDAAVEMGE